MQLLNLADELLLAIVDQIDDGRTLCNLARTCSKFQMLSEPHIYKSILILNGTLAKDILAKGFTKRRARLSAVQDLAIRYHYTMEEGIEELEPLLYFMTQLRHLLIEAPCCNDTPWSGHQSWDSYGRIDYGKLFEASLSIDSSIRPRPLAHLESLTLHSHYPGTGGRSRYDLGNDAVIFLHPTLRFIKLSCFDIGPDCLDSQTYDYEKSYKSTALKILIFEECNISGAGLAILLTLPKALRELTLGERMYHSDKNPWEVLDNDQITLRRALSYQRQSLEYLKHVGGHFPRHWQAATPIASDDLEKLKYLEVDYYSLFIGAFFKQDLPPQLEVLKIFDTPFSEPTALKRLSNHLLLHNQSQNLSHLILVAPNSRFLFQSDAQREELIRVNSHDIGPQFHKRKIAFSVYYVPRSEQHFIPPYMFGEVVPFEVLAYSSSQLPDSDDEPNLEHSEAEVRRMVLGENYNFE